jgi:hypothetical protein
MKRLQALRDAEASARIGMLCGCDLRWFRSGESA